MFKHALLRYVLNTEMSLFIYVFCVYMYLTKGSFCLVMYLSMFVHVLCVEVPLHRSVLVAFMSPGMFKHAKDIKVLPLTRA